MENEDKILEEATKKEGIRKRDKIKAHISKKQFWQVTTVIFAIMFVWAAYTVYFSIGETYPDVEIVKMSTMEFIESEMISPGVTVNLVNFTDEGCFYKMNLNLEYEGQVQEVESYVSMRGDLFFPQAIEINNSEILDLDENKGEKREVPVVELFVMSHCPYGTQIEKGMIPVIKTLQDKIDFEMKFVYYVMHGMTEVDEQLLQYCIQKDYNEKYIDYLSTFLEDGNTSRSLGVVGLTQEELSACITVTDEQHQVTELFNDESTWLSGRFPLFNVYKLDNERYEVGGSPTLVINGETVSASRDSASLLKAICEGFVDKPTECSAVLSGETPSPGFGYGTGSDDGGSCE